MRLIVGLTAIAILAVPGRASAQTAGKLDGDKLRDTGVLQSKMPSQTRNPCAGYGPGFVLVAGTSTCAKIGGSISVGVGTSSGGSRNPR